jgi:hypothetical protein
MKKMFVCYFSLLVCTTAIFAQDKQREAKAAYLLAEESFGKGDYKATLDFLQQTRTSLGAVNCKILFLQIMATREMYAKDPQVSNRILPLIDEFEKSADYKDFTEEKILEISKLKLLMKLQQKALKEKTDKENTDKAANAVLEKAFEEVHSSLGPFKITQEELARQKSEWEIGNWKFSKKIKLYLAPGIEVNTVNPSENFPFFAADKDLKNKTISFYIDPAGLIRQYSSILVYTDKKMNSLTPEASLKEADAVIEAYKKKLGVEPRVETIEQRFDRFRASLTIYSWHRAPGRNILLYRLHFPNGDLPIVKLALITSSNLD